jgi:hypothetical protein
MYWLFPFLYMEEGPLEKRIKKLTSVVMKVFKTATTNTLHDHNRSEAILEDMKGVYYS